MFGMYIRMKKAIILSRVSSLYQDLEQQTEAVLKEVKKDGYKEEDIIIIEDKESAIKLSEEERNGLNKMKEYICNDPNVNAVYLYELSRLSRRQLVLFSIRDFLIERNIQLVCLQPYMKLLDSDGTMSQTASLMFSIFSSFSESEMALKKVRMMRGRKHNVAIGKIGGGRPPFGYSINKEKFYIIDPKQSEIVKRFFYEYAKGDKSIADIAKELKEEGLFPNTSFYTLHHDLSVWLEREFYTGIFPYPQIISKSVYERVQSERKKRKTAPKRSHKNRFLLKGLIVNGSSGKRLSAMSGNDSYTVSHYGGMTIKRKLIDPIVWDFAKAMYRKHLMNRNILKRQLQKELITISKKIETIKGEIQSLKDKVDKVEERMIFGRLSSQRGDELIQTLSEQLSEREKRLLELTNESAAKHMQLTEADYMEDFNEDSLSLDERIAIVRKVVKRITIVRPLKFTAHISIFNRINDIVTVYEVKGRRYTSTLIKEYHKKDER